LALQNCGWRYYSVKVYLFSFAKPSILQWGSSMDFGKHKRKYGVYKWIRNITSFFFFFWQNFALYQYFKKEYFVTTLPLFKKNKIKKDIFWVNFAKCLFLSSKCCRQLDYRRIFFLQVLIAGYQLFITPSWDACYQCSNRNLKNR
jgi:hypothetical protein